MASPDDELQRYFSDLPMVARRKVAATIRQEADGLAGAIKQAAPVKTGNLRDSVRVRRGRHTLELVVEAGGQLTTREVRKGSDVDYDYAMAQEFGTRNMAAQPYFFNTCRERREEIEANIQAAVQEAFDG